MLNEYIQLNIGTVPGKPVFGCIDPSTISNEEKRRALEAVNLLKRKGAVKLKAERVPTVANKSVS